MRRLYIDILSVLGNLFAIAVASAVVYLMYVELKGEDDNL